MTLMGRKKRQARAGSERKIRVAFRQNRSKPARVKDWNNQARQIEGGEIETRSTESVVAKGSLSRGRTVIVRPEREGTDVEPDRLRRGTVVTMRGLFAEVDDGEQVHTCTVRRVLRTRKIDERHPVVVGDRVRFLAPGQASDGEEGVIEQVEERRGQLSRRSGGRVQTIAANVDQVVIVTSAAHPFPKPRLIDRYIVAALAGDIVPLVCVNKMDLDEMGRGGELVDLYHSVGHQVLGTSVVNGSGLDPLRALLQDRCTLFAGQSGVGKSSLLNALQPGLDLKVAEVARHNTKGRHTTTTARLIRLDLGGYVVDTPGIRSLDLSLVARNEFERYFIEFVRFVSDCKFPDCTHTHETDCAVREAVDRGAVSTARYESYCHLFSQPGPVDGD